MKRPTTKSGKQPPVEISSVLIANRGEIACRVMKTLRRMKIRSIAIYSDADANSLHVEMADEAHRVGPAPASESYLDAQAIIEVARRTGAQAIHPGYGFLSENAEFAEACERAGLIFIGPSADVIRSMGAKDEAKRRMAEVGIPVIPGHFSPDQEAEALKVAAAALGYPLLIKAVAGGGGRGMRVVGAADEFESALAAARREANSAFGDERMLLEKLLSPARHVEVQIFGDAHGNVVHLFERDCSLQRRHQKVIEEAPAPGLSEQYRGQLGDAAVLAAKAIGYVGAGTVEFLIDVDSEQGSDYKPFYFMEMNTRLQVEHPVSEMITGVDLVEWQIRVAAGEAIPRSQKEITLDGHSIEVRICAEDPARAFLPTAGHIQYLGTPATGDTLRLETGVRSGDDVSVHYDSMIAKLVAWGEDREIASIKLAEGLADFHLEGFISNQVFLSRAIQHPAFEAGSFDTGFMDQYEAELVAGMGAVPDRILALVALEAVLSRPHLAASARRRRLAPGAHLRTEDRSPFEAVDSFQVNLVTREELVFEVEGESRVVGIALLADGRYRITLSEGSWIAEGTSLAYREMDSHKTAIHRFEAEVCGVETEKQSAENARELQATVLHRGGNLTVFLAGEVYRLRSRDLDQQVFDETERAGGIVTPMPGKIIEVAVAQGDRVCAGQTLLILEAMKMEHSVKAPVDSVVECLDVEVGDQVEEGKVLLVLASDDELSD
jgi:3-methylcrotonyl-CoA carboxylase alpha subunit